MSEISVVTENPITMAELKDRLSELKKKQDLSFRGNKTLDYLNIFSKASNKDVDGMKEKLKALELVRLKERHIVKIIDIMPENAESLKTLLANENITLKEEELTKILACLK